MRIGVLGGTGPAGRGLAARLSDLGHEVVVGSRDADRARATVEALRSRWGDRLDGLTGTANEAAAEAGELVVIAVPWEAASRVAAATAPLLAGKVVISMANALEMRDGGFVAVITPRRSVAAEVAAAAPQARIVAALHHVPAKDLGDLEAEVDGDVLVCSNDREAARDVCDLVSKIPRLQAFDVGALANAVGIEAFTAVLLSMNVRYNVRTAIRITGLPR